MDKLAHYQELIEKKLLEIQAMLAQDEDCEALLCIDRQRGQYILMSDGWYKGNRHYHPIVHLEIRPDGEVWLRADNTDLAVGNSLIEQGIEKRDLVPAFYSPTMREYAQKANGLK